MKKVVESVTRDFPVDARDAPPKPRAP